MDPKRKAIFALIGVAMLLNISYGLINNGFPSPFIDELENVSDELISVKSVMVPPLREGGLYRSRYNMTVNVEKENGDQTSGYHIEGIITRNIKDHGILKKTDGSYQSSYQVNRTDYISILGDMHRSRDTLLTDSGIVEKETLKTTLTMRGPKGPGPGSNIESTINGGPTLRTDNIWKMITTEADELFPSSEGRIDIDIDLQEIGASINEISMEWSVRDIFESMDGRRALVVANSTSWTGGIISLMSRFRHGCPWPERTDIAVIGRFQTEDGPIDISMEMSEEITDWSKGEGGEIPFGYIGRSSDPYYVGGHDPAGVVPAEGQVTAFRGTPQEAFSVCISDGTLLNSLAETSGWENLTFTNAQYGKNDTVEPMWTWNITIAGPPSSEGVSKSVEFKVGVEGGGMLGKKRFTLLSEREKVVIRYPDPKRELITLSKGEEVLKSSVYRDSFFRGDAYSSTYRLDIISRVNTCSDPRSIVFMNVLGIDRADISDLHLSRAIDRSEPSIMYLLVMDATNGGIISETRLEGAGITLLNVYGFDLA